MSQLVECRRPKKCNPAWEESFGRTSLDRLADAWARERGTKLPDGRHAGQQIGTKLLSQRRIRRTLERRAEADRMRGYLGLLEARLRETDWRGVFDPFERGRLERKVKILHMRYREGRLQREIGEAFGWSSYHWTGIELRRLRREALGGNEAPRGRTDAAPAGPWAGFVGKSTWRGPRRLDDLLEFVRSRRSVKAAEAIRAVPLGGDMGLSVCLARLREWTRGHGLAMPIELVERRGERVLRWIGGRRASLGFPESSRRMLAIIRKRAPVGTRTIMRLLGIDTLSKFGRCFQDLRSAIAILGGPRVIVSRRGQGHYFSFEDHYASRSIPLSNA